MRGVIDDIISLFFPSARISAFRSLAKKYGWGFKSRISFKSDPISRYPFNLFQGKKDKRLIGVIVPNNKRVGQYRIYDYNYFGDFGRRTSTVFEFVKGRSGPERRPANEKDIRQRIKESLDLPAFSIQPKGGFRSIKKIFFKKIEPLIPTTPEFREHYTIATHEPMDLRLALPAEFLDEIGDHPGWTFEGREEVLIAYQLGEQMKPEQVEENFAFFEQLCRYLVK
jgi:hypothetical protein